MFDPTPVRARRIAALLIDLGAGLCSAVFMAIAALVLPDAADGFLAYFCLFLAGGYLYCRDWLTGGRSIGKRLCGLSVVDRATGDPATGKQLLVLDVCFFLLPFDAVVLLLTGRSIGERISGAAVVRGTASRPIAKKRLVTVAAIAAVLGLLLNGAVVHGLEQAKQNESYALALEYLTASSTFAAQESSGTEPALVGFASTTHGTQPSHHYTFDTASHTYSVTCHPQEDGTWAVCVECTELE